MSEGEASPPAPLQGERGGSKLRGCDSQDMGIQTKSVKSVKSVGQNEEGEASSSAPLQGERGGRKLRGCDSQDRGSHS